MKFSERTLALIGALAQINDGLIFKTGSTLRTKNAGNSILAEVNISESIPKDFAITDLRRFLSAHSMFGEPEIDITDTHVILDNGTEKFKYTCANPAVINAPPDGPVKQQEVVETLELDKQSLARILKAIGMLGEAAEHPEVVFKAEDGQIVVQVTDTRNTSCPVYRKVLGSTEEAFDVVFAADKFKIHPSDYKVELSANSIKLIGDDIWYIIMADIKRSH